MPGVTEIGVTETFTGRGNTLYYCPTLCSNFVNDTYRPLCTILGLGIPLLGSNTL